VLLYSIGDEVEGKVIKIKDFGAFIEIEEGLNGLLHISEMAWTYVKNPSELVSEGEVLKLRILEIDPEKRKISLGLKQLLANPWEDVKKKYPVGTVVIDWEYVEKPAAIFKKFMVLPLKVIKIDEDAHLIFLSRKRTLPNPWDDVDNFYKIDSIVKGKVIRVRDFGAFVKLDKGIEGFVPVSEIDWDRIKHPSEKLKKDKEYEFKIIKIDKEKLQLTLSTKRPLSEISHKKIDSPESVLSIGEEVSTLVIKLDSRRKKISLSIKRAEKEEQKRFMKEYNKKQSVDKILFKDLFGDLFTKK